MQVWAMCITRAYLKEATVHITLYIIAAAARYRTVKASAAAVVTESLHSVAQVDAKMCCKCLRLVLLGTHVKVAAETATWRLLMRCVLHACAVHVFASDVM
jgi:hypothetical protein